jgi:hypothetical protein
MAIITPTDILYQFPVMASLLETEQQNRFCEGTMESASRAAGLSVPTAALWRGFPQHLNYRKTKWDEGQKMETDISNVDTTRDTHSKELIGDIIFVISL